MDTPCRATADHSIQDGFDHRADDTTTFTTLAPSHHLGISSLVRLLTIGIGLMVAEALENRIEELQRE
jgi:hypothetical protein